MSRLACYIGSIVPAAIFLMLASCGKQPYPTHLAYRLRADWLVGSLPNSAPDGPPPAGKLDEFVAAINDRGGRAYNPADLSAEQKSTLKKILDEIFGSPGSPKIDGQKEAAQTPSDHLGLQPGSLSEGSKLYRQHCLQCHGLMGDGRGPTGMWVYPYPRDFRQGIFKYVSSVGTAARKPTRADLHRVLQVGVERTSMPAFSLLSDLEREQLIAYTIHLSLRGEVEFRLMLKLLVDNEEVDIADDARAYLQKALDQWVEADRESIAPVSLPTPELQEEKLQVNHQESIRRGFELFARQGTGCLSCHENYGRQARYLYDAWGGSVRVTDLTEGVFRGGKRPLDLYHRVRGGIGPSGMPAVTGLSESQMWDLVHFVDALPFQRLLPADVREQIYPSAPAK